MQKMVGLSTRTSAIAVCCFNDPVVILHQLSNENIVILVAVAKIQYTRDDEPMSASSFP
jgi:hypothetical protein